MTIATMRSSLTQDDIRRLVRGDSPEARANAAHKICRRIDTMEMSEGDKESARQVLDLMCNDTAVLVRRALAVTLRNSPKLPRDIALKLARDVDAIAVPVLKNSPVITDEDLVEIVLAGAAEKQVAIAQRASLGEGLTEVIALYAAKPAVEACTLNEGATFSDDAFAGLLKRFANDNEIKGALVSRNALPIHVTEKLVNMVTGELFDRLVNKHELPPQLAIEIASGTRERATLDLVEQAGLTSDPERFVQQLHLNGRLTPSLIMRSLCLGHIGFVEHAMAELAGVPRSKSWLMIHDAGALGLKTIFERAGLPSGMFTAFRLAIDIYHKTEMDGGDGDRNRFRQKMVERVLTQFQAIPRADLEYLLEKLDALDTIRERVVAA
ncbi:MAG: hypothetical protein B7Z38_01040 [Rhodobacterales bacterium 12-64-8]|nr:MAG: hypothetical protein B7Z38_01040 [Rhodobacterales bacterium 12-64-8]OYX48957.1 MAG: hypothetical protein B7Y90_08480 [Alphaproteobacteria bacterium 32-64-14]